MYSAFAVLLSRHTQQKQILVGTGVANRTMKQTEELLGMFVNVVLLHSNLTGNPTFAELLSKTREDMLAVYVELHITGFMWRLRLCGVEERKAWKTGLSWASNST